MFSQCVAQLRENAVTLYFDCDEDIPERPQASTTVIEQLEVYHKHEVWPERRGGRLAKLTLKRHTLQQQHAPAEPENPDRKRRKTVNCCCDSSHCINETKLHQGISDPIEHKHALGVRASSHLGKIRRIVPQNREAKLRERNADGIEVHRREEWNTGTLCQSKILSIKPHIVWRQDKTDSLEAIGCACFSITQIGAPNRKSVGPRKNFVVATSGARRK